MSDWTRVADKLPREGKAVDIRMPSGQIAGMVLFENGRFWKKRIGSNAGHSWNPVEWRYPDKKKGAIDVGEDETADNREK